MQKRFGEWNRTYAVEQHADAAEDSTQKKGKIG